MSREAAVSFAPPGPLRGDVRVPGDKSIMQRALLVGAVCDGDVEIVDPVWAGDPVATAGMVEALGARVDGLAGRAPGATVHGRGLRGLRPPAAPLDAGNSGTGMRLLAGLLAGQDGRFTIDGDASLRRRPMGRIVEPLRAMGVRVEARDGAFAPLVVEGGPVKAIRYETPVASAQVKSCVLLAGLFAEGATTVVEAAASRDHTERMLRAAGAEVRSEGCEARVTGGRELRLGQVAIPGDVSSAAFLVAAALLVGGSEVRIGGVGLNPTRSAFLTAVRGMGAAVDWHVEAESGGEPAGTIEARASALHGITVGAADVPAMIDEVTLLALLAAFAEGETVVEGVGDLRAKESDRLEAIVGLLRGLGGRAEATGDRLVVHGTCLRGGRVDSLGDHRLALLGAVAGLACPEGVTVEGFAVADVSFPGFIHVLQEVTGR
jgi:3-phosphoshikimate 1-carboxyvinyltransferase